MVTLYFKCVICGRRWTRKVDEHDVPRYFKMEKNPPHPDAHCPCGPQRVMKFPKVVMENVCEYCDD